MLIFFTSNAREVSLGVPRSHWRILSRARGRCQNSRPGGGEEEEEEGRRLVAEHDTLHVPIHNRYSDVTLTQGNYSTVKVISNKVIIVQ